jgi:methyltransferase (TIGR00027 family)
VIPGRASSTAALIATARGLGRVLPFEAQLAHDPFGERFAEGGLRIVAHFAHRWPFRTKLRNFLLGVQVRTRAIDLALESFLRDGGTQVVVLGAGYDARAWRFADALTHSLVFEVDHPATQARKRALLEGPRHVRFIPWDFESRTTRELGSALAGLGHRSDRPTLTIWEGVTPYLTPAAVAESMDTIATYASPGSVLAFTYGTPETTQHEHPTYRTAASLGERFHFGLQPDQTEAWLGAHGFSLIANDSLPAWARMLLPPQFAQELARDGLDAYLAVARRV